VHDPVLIRPLRIGHARNFAARAAARDRTQSSRMLPGVIYSIGSLKLERAITRAPPDVLNIAGLSGFFDPIARRPGPIER
jgi:hypothetical protein